MIFKDYYKILDLDSNKMTLEEIKMAFREQAKKYHPDINNESEERFKDINEAYRVLSNATTRKKYDRMWNSYIGKKRQKTSYEESKREKGSVFSEFFNMFFGGQEEQASQKTSKKLPIKGENVETQINIKLEEGYFGAEKRISLRAVNGKMKTFTVKIPEGIRDSEKIRLIGQGKQGINGGKNGDLFIKINIENNNKFKLDGYDLITDLFVTPWEAALGKRVSVDSLEGNSTIYIPPGIQSGEKIRIAKKGYKDGQGSRGDLVAQVKTVVPKQLTNEEKELFEKLQTISKFNPRNGV